ncbi:MAG: hypothetical protein OXG65_11920 [Chloroflexi bacterium]|nr:hypothetical protein [Chloroflexota bacterium]
MGEKACTENYRISYYQLLTMERDALCVIKSRTGTDELTANLRARDSHFTLSSEPLMKEKVAIDPGTVGTEGFTTFGGERGSREGQLTSDVSIEKSSFATRLKSIRKVDIAANVDIIRH